MYSTIRAQNSNFWNFWIAPHIMVHIPDLSGAHKKQKPCVVMDYYKNEIGGVKSDQMLSYHLFERKLVKW
jgi:hypothetical protein